MGSDVKFRILIVEDESIEAMNFEQSLKSFGYDVVGIASTGKDAIKKVAVLKPDLILMDIVLKGDLDGIEAASRIKEDFDTPVVYLTAHPEESAVQRAKLTTPYGYLIKPVNKTELRNSIELAIYKHGMEKRLKENEERLRVVLDSVEDIVFIKDTNLRYVEVNSALEQSFGIKREQIIGNTDKKLFPEDIEHIRLIDERVLNNETIKEETPPSGIQNAIFDVIKSPMYNKKGEIIGLCGIARDITKLKQAEIALIESEKSYRELVDNSMVAIYKTNINGDILFANNAMVDIFNFKSVEELKSVKSPQLYKNQKERKNVIDKLKKKGSFSQYQLEMVSKTGNTLNILLSANLSNEIISGMMINISELKIAEEELLFKTTLLEAQLESTVDGILVVDDKAKIVLFNKHFKEIWNIPQYILDSKDDKKVFQYALKNFKDPGSFIKKIEYLYAHKNEKIRDQLELNDGRIFDRYSSPLLGEKGHYYGRIWYFRDITNHKLMEDALRASEEKYRALFESDPDYTILIGLDGVLADVNPAAERITGLSKDKLVGKHFSELDIFPKEEFDFHKKNFSKLSIQGNVDPHEARIIDKNGKFRWVLNKFTTVTKNDKLEYVLIIGSDITERKLAENEIKSSLKEKEVLLKEIHHRVKNNLQIISSLLDLQEYYVKEDPKAVNILKESQNRVLSMAMLHEMLYISKDLNKINFSDYIRNLVSNLFHSYGTENTITLTIKVVDVFLNIETAVPCGLIISELVSNSLKYAYTEDATGELLISLKPIKEEFELIISDNGVGFPESIDFRKTESSLGLRLVNSLVQQLDGTINLDRSQGTKFTIKFKEQKYKERI